MSVHFTSSIQLPKGAHFEVMVQRQLQSSKKRDMYKEQIQELKDLKSRGASKELSRLLLRS